MLSIPFNPYTWDGTRKRVNSDVLALDLKDETRNVIKVSNLSSDIIIVTSLQPQVIALEKPQYFTKNENLRFHEIKHSGKAGNHSSRVHCKSVCLLAVWSEANYKSA